MARSKKNDLDAERRTQILEAALHCFLHFGYAKTSLDDVAKRADLSRTLIYMKFKNKENLFDGVIGHLTGGRTERADAILKSTASKEEKLLQISEILLIEPWEKISGFPMSSDLYDRCSLQNPEAVQKFSEHFIKCAQDILGDKEAGEVFFYATEGLHSDVPTVNVLRKRFDILVDKFVK